MITFDHSTLRLCGVPLFTLVVGIVFLVAITGLTYGIVRRKQRSGKIALLAAALVLLLFALAFILVLITVACGSMG